MSNTVTADRLGDIVLIVEDEEEAEEEQDDDLDRACADPQEYETTSMEDFVFRTRGQSEEEPLRLEAISHLNKPNNSSSNNNNDSTDDHTDDTCEASSPISSQHGGESHQLETGDTTPFVDMVVATALPQREMPSSSSSSSPPWMHDLMWLVICFVGIMASFVAYGILLEYATTGDRRLHELSFLFVVSVLGTVTAWTGRTVKKETITDIPANRFLLLGLMSLGSTFCAIRSLRYVIFPIQVLARSCKPVPVLLIGTLLGKKYPRRKFISVFIIVCGVAMFMGGGNILKGEGDSSDDSGSSDVGVAEGGNNSSDISSLDAYTTSGSGAEEDEESMAPIHKQIFGVVLLIASLFFDGGTGAYEDKLMSMHSVEPFDLMFKFQLSKALLSAFALVIFNQTHLLVEMIQQTGMYIIALGMCSAIGQVFIFITIAKFGALTTSLMSLTRKVTTLTASIIIYDHDLTGVQLAGLFIAVGAMLMNFVRPKEKTDNDRTGSGNPKHVVKGGYASLPTEMTDAEHSTEIVAKDSPV